MVQRSNLRARKHASAGSLRKKLGFAKKHKGHGGKLHNVRDKATSNYISQIETQMASRLPSDQRDKLTTVKPGGPPVEKKSKKKPLTRGRRRKH